MADALIVLGLASFGDAGASFKALGALCHEGESPEMAAQAVLDAALDVIENAIKDMLHEWSIQPVYTVSDVLSGSDFVPQQLVGVGGGAPGLIHALGRRMGLPVVIPPGGMVANAIGAALARPTVAASLRADTTEGYYLIPESGKRERLPKRFNMQAAEEILSAWLHEKAGGWRAAKPKLSAVNISARCTDIMIPAKLFTCVCSLNPAFCIKLPAGRWHFETGKFRTDIFPGF